MNTDTIKLLFEEMRKFGVLLFEHTAPSGECYKIVLKDSESVDASGLVVQTQDEEEEDGMGFDVNNVKRSIYENPTLGLKDFDN